MSGGSASAEGLLKSRRLAWVDKNYGQKGEFGPPAFDETNRSYMWRVFKRGFTWGKSAS